jgi:hypothetical protein
MDMHTYVEQEIRELHAFFEAWYRGTIEDTDSAYSRLENVLAPEFTLITSDGYTMPREQLLPLLRTEHARRPEIEMCVDHIQLRLVSGELVLITYQEHGSTANGSKSTLITAVLRANPDTPNGLEWVHIHEVLLPESG